jgi:hypothetical protein
VPGSPAGPELLINGDFNTGTPSPWTPFGQIDWRVDQGVFEFIRLAGLPAGVVLQRTLLPMNDNQIMTATFQLGNSSNVRKRVTVIMHDFDFSDMHACAFWLAPFQPLSNYAMQTYATKAWSDATIAFYGATPGPQQWIRLDNVSLTRTQAAAISGTNCLEPGAVLNNAPAGAAISDVKIPIAAGTGAAPGTVSVASDVDTVLDLRGAIEPRLTLRSWLIAGADDPVAEVQVSTDGVTWVTVGLARASDNWETLDLDLGDFAGQVIRVRFVITAANDRRPALWQIENIR